MLWVGLMMLAGVLVARGQDRGPDDRGPRPPRGPHPARVRGERGGPPPFRAVLGNPLRPLPEDLGPLRPGEEEELLEFARTHLRRQFQMLRRLRTRNPARFQERFERVLPRLRQLRRLFDENPTLARYIVRHVENLEAIKARLRHWRARPEEREGVRGQVRARVAENLRLERLILEERLSELQDRRDRLVDRELDRLLYPKTDLAPEPERLRALVERYDSAVGDDEREQILDDIREMIGERLDHEVKRLQHRLREMRENRTAEVDQRVDDLFRPGGGPGPGPPGDRRARPVRPSERRPKGDDRDRSRGDRGGGSGKQRP
jgi:hypothetical protein